jgi:hypothetical protein
VSRLSIINPFLSPFIALQQLCQPSGKAKPAPPENPMSADRVRWEHIQRVYELCNRDVSKTARRRHMHWIISKHRGLRRRERFNPDATSSLVSAGQGKADY